MEPWLVQAILGGLIGGVVASLAVPLVMLLMPRRKCPECGEQLPRFRSPANARQGLWGGWTCPKCGCEVDRRGRKVSDV
jgi:hypothetical protein